MHFKGCLSSILYGICNIKCFSTEEINNHQTNTLYKNFQCVCMYICYYFRDCIFIVGKKWDWKVSQAKKWIIYIGYFVSSFILATMCDSCNANRSTFCRCLLFRGQRVNSGRYQNTYNLWQTINTSFWGRRRKQKFFPCRRRVCFAFVHWVVCIFNQSGREDRSRWPVVSGHLPLNIRPVSYFK